jgi:hypothetical protein
VEVASLFVVNIAKTIDERTLLARLINVQRSTGVLLSTSSRLPKSLMKYIYN